MLPHELELPEVKQLMLDYTTCINSKCDTTKFLVNPNVPIDKHDQYIDAFRSLEEINATSSQWDGDHRYLPYKPTSEESAMEQMDEYIGLQSYSPQLDDCCALQFYQLDAVDDSFHEGNLTLAEFYGIQHHH